MGERKGLLNAVLGSQDGIGKNVAGIPKEEENRLICIGCEEFNIG